MLLLTIKVRSRSGNVVLAVLGATYAAAAAYLLGWAMLDAGVAFGSNELNLTVVLIGSILCGAWFLAVAVRNIGVSRWLRRLPIGRALPATAATGQS